MEIRKLQSTGGASLIVTLPKRWIRRLGLTKKDSVVLSLQSSGALIIQPAKKRLNMARTSIHLTGLTGGMLVREIIAHYVAGADEIVITSPKLTPEQRNTIRDTSKLLIGFETLDESSKSMVVKNVFDVTKFPTQQNIESMFVTARSMFEDALRALKDNDRLLAADIIDRDVEVDKLQLAITRQFHILLENRVSQEELGLDSEDLEFYNGVANQLERIADHAVKLARLIPQSKKKKRDALVARQILAIAPAVLTLLEDAHEAVRAMNVQFAHQLLNACTNSSLSALPFSQSKTNRTPAEVLAIDSLDRLRGYVANIAEMTIDHAAVKTRQQA